MRRHLTLALLLAPCVPVSLALAAPTDRVLKTRFTYTATVASAPPASKTLHLWVPVPSDNPLQTIGPLAVTAPGPHEVTTESANGNRMVHVEADPAKLPLTVTIAFDVARRAAGAAGATQDRIDPAHYLEADHLVPISGRSAELGEEVAGKVEGAEAKMRAIYDHVVATMQYDYKKESPKLGEGNVPFVCDYKKGNCSDLHSYVIALARSQGVPAYLEYGFPITGIPLQDPIPITGKVGGYHCWTWFHVDGKGWLALDASDGRRWLDSNKPDIKDTLVGNLVLERGAVAFSRGRDITLVPPQVQPPLNYFIYPYAEADGEPVAAAWTVSYELAPPDGVEAQIAQLRQLVIAQQAEIDRLKGERDAAKPTAPKAPMGTASGEILTVYGQARLDVVHDSAHAGPNSQSAFFVKSPDDPAVAERDNDQFTVYPRLSRVGLNIKAPPETIPGWALTGKFEIDFQGGGSESRPTPRARLLYADLKKGGHSWRLGQDWDVISPLWPSPNDDTGLWNAGNLGDRRGQARYTYDRGKGASIAAAVVLSGAIDAKDLDQNGVRDGEDSGMPGLQARFGWKASQGAIGLWGHHDWEETTNAVGGKRRFNSSSIGLDFAFNLGKKVDVRGEAWSGRNLADVRGGIGQGVTASTGDVIRARGGWFEMGFVFVPKHRLVVGTSLDDPDDDHLAGASARTRNAIQYVSNKWQLARDFELGANLLFWETDYLGQRTGNDRRINVYLSRKF